MKNILCISMCLPYKEVSHAGGKTVNYYLSRFAKEENIKVTVVCKVREKEIALINDKYNNEFDVYYVQMPGNKALQIFAYGRSIWSKINPFSRYGNTLTFYIYSQYFKKLSKLKKNGYVPDIIILEWTEMVLCIEKIKKYFPDSKIIASEHDVKFQSEQRKYNKETNILNKTYRFCVFKNMKKKELAALKKADLIVTQSEKDKAILQKNGIISEKQFVISPYYMRSKKSWNGIGAKNIAIYGDMSRPENYESAIWFIENVFNKIKVDEIKLYIIGGGPADRLKKFDSEKIIITGFVDDVFSYFDNCFCMVVPLQTGAGIKVKCLEAISFGIPLIANDIAIEGIALEDEKNFLYCKSCEDFLYNILKLYKDFSMQRKLSSNAKDFANCNLNIDNSYREYFRQVRKVLESGTC